MSLQFRTYSYRIGLPAEKEVEQLHAPPIAIVGWIPHFANVAQMPDCAFKSRGLRPAKWKGRLATSLIFRSGNPPPGGYFADGSQFLQSIFTKKEFRGMIAVNEVIVGLCAKGQVTSVHFDYVGGNGYTPTPNDPQHSRGYLPGDGRADKRVTVARDEYVNFKVWRYFKPSHWVDDVNHFLTDQFSSFASLQLSYTVRLDGQVTIELESSAVPSQSVCQRWQDWNVVHDMLTISDSEIEAFVSAGKNQDAPTTLRAKLSDSVSRKIL